MPRRAARPCRAQGCPNLVWGDVIYCAQHAHLENDRKRRYDAIRGTAAQRGYDARWNRIRSQFLAHHPICRHCGESATVAHHIIRRRSGGSDDDGNLLPLCASCHSRLHASAGEGWGASPAVGKGSQNR